MTVEVMFVLLVVGILTLTIISRRQDRRFRQTIAKIFEEYKRNMR